MEVSHVLINTAINCQLRHYSFGILHNLRATTYLPKMGYITSGYLPQNTFYLCLFWLKYHNYIGSFCVYIQKIYFKLNVSNRRKRFIILMCRNKSGVKKGPSNGCVQTPQKALRQSAKGGLKWLHSQWKFPCATFFISEE